jgi:asparagine synthase (glutamine-hydrolysing)
MSGYAVVVRQPGAVVAKDELRSVMEPLRRRGPHGESILVDGAFGAASTLLDVGDRRLGVAWATAGALIVAGQVRVDARAELVGALSDAGAPSAEDEPDVQLFARAWRTWGADAPERMLGEFSAVIHDRESHVTTLVRDPFGVRMLFLHDAPDRLIASNTLAAVLATGISRELDEDAIADFIADGANEDPAATSFRAVRRVPAGHLLRLHPDGRRELSRYWDIPSPEIDRSRDAATIVAEFRAQLEASVRDRLRAPRVTVFMSGGLDSPTLAAIAVRELGDPSLVVARTAHLPTLVPDDETPRARLAAQSLGIAHVLTDVDGYGYREGTIHPLPRTPEPYDDPDLLALHDELRRASAHAPVAFWGEDPDAYLAPPDLSELLRDSGAPRLALDVAAYAWREGARPHLAVRNLLRARFARGEKAGDDGGPPWLRDDLRRRRAERLRARVDATHPTRSEAARRLDAWHWQPFLESLDAGFHGVPVEVRLPYLDLRLIRFALAAPPIPWMQRKHLLREAARGLIPEVVRTAPKRGVRGLYAARLRQWWSRAPEPFVPSAALARFVDPGAIPSVTPDSGINESMVHLRLRILDRWLAGL